MALLLMRNVVSVCPWITMLIPGPAGEPDPLTPAVPIVLPLISPVMVPPVDCDDENTFISCNDPATLDVIVLFLKLKSRFDEVSWVKLAPMPLLVNVLD